MKNTKYNIQKKEIGLENLTRNSNTCVILSLGTLKDVVGIASKLGPGRNPETHLRGVLLQWGIIIFLRS